MVEDDYIQLISVIDLLKEVLKFIVPFRPPIIEAFVNEVVAK
jgi:hypothetical protein